MKVKIYNSNINPKKYFMLKLLLLISYKLNKNLI